MNKKKIISIMQPHFFPRIAFFDLILKSDVFVVLDNVQFERQSWQMRNRILTKDGILYINLPILKKQLKTEIKDIMVKPIFDWSLKLKKTLIQNYAKSKHKSELNNLIENLFDFSSFKNLNENKLSDINLHFIKIICKSLKIKFEPILSSDLNVSGLRTERLINILNKLNAKIYYTVDGSKEYLKEDSFTIRSDVELKFQKQNFVEYKQIHSKKFVPNLSILDSIASIGLEKTKINLES